MSFGVAIADYWKPLTWTALASYQAFKLGSVLVSSSSWEMTDTIPSTPALDPPQSRQKKVTGPVLTNRSIAEAATLGSDVDRLAAYQRALERLRSRRAPNCQSVGLFLMWISREEES
jgi:hypothetical protein